MGDEDRRSYLRRDEDRDLLVDHAARLGRLERDVRDLASHTDREFDNLDLKFPSFDAVAKDYVPRSEHRNLAGDRRQVVLLYVAIGGLFISPFLSAFAAHLMR